MKNIGGIMLAIVLGFNFLGASPDYPALAAEIRQEMTAIDFASQDELSGYVARKDFQGLQIGITSYSAGVQVVLFKDCDGRSEIYEKFVLQVDRYPATRL